MIDLVVVNPEYEFSYYSAFMLVVWHSETLERLHLVIGPNVSQNPAALQPESLLDLQPGRVRHRKNLSVYHANGRVWSEEGTCMWYTALYASEDGMGPHWVRPLHTADGAGWLDPVDGQLRFERLDDRIKNALSEKGA